MDGLDLQSRKVWLGGSAVLALLVLAVAWFFAIGPKRSDASDLRAQTTSAQLQNAQLGAQNAALTKKSQHLSAYRAKLAAALDALPAHNELSSFSQSLVGYAERTGVNLTSISVGSPTAVASAAPVEPTPEATDSGTGSTDGSDATTAPAPAVSTASGPLATTFTLQATGTTAQELAFLAAIRTGPRSALIASSSFAAGDNGGSISLDAQVNVFSSPVPAAELDQLRALLAPSK